MADVDRRMKAKEKQRAKLAAQRYDQQREMLRLEMMRAEADAAFFARVLLAPASVVKYDYSRESEDGPIAAVRREHYERYRRSDGEGLGEITVVVREGSS